MNKSSLRAEFDALKARFESLCVEGKMSADSRALFDALLMLFELLMAVFMEKHTPKGSANSSLPASQSPNDDTARTGPGAKGKGPSYNDARCANTRTRESIRVLAVDACGRCGEDLTDTACLGHERRTSILRIFGGVRQPFHQPSQSVRIKVIVQIALELLDPFAIVDPAGDGPSGKRTFTFGLQPRLKTPLAHRLRPSRVCFLFLLGPNGPNVHIWTS